MAKLTSAMVRELNSIKQAAAEGLPAQLRDFAWLAADSFLAWRPVYLGEFTRKQLQSHIDTLKYLITLGVHDR
jgi:hypothetical protein